MSFSSLSVRRWDGNTKLSPKLTKQICVMAESVLTFKIKTPKGGLLFSQI